VKRPDPACRYAHRAALLGSKAKGASIAEGMRRAHKARQQAGGTRETAMSALKCHAHASRAAPPSHQRDIAGIEEGEESLKLFSR